MPNSGYIEPGGSVYSIPLAGTAISSTSDVMQIIASTGSRVVVREIKIGQYSDFGDAQAEILQVRLLRGSTTSSTGVALTPQNVQRHSGAPSAGTTAKGPTSTLTSTTSAVLTHAEAFNAAAGWLFRPDVVERPVLSPGERLNIRVSGPADALTVNATAIIQEIGT